MWTRALLKNNAKNVIMRRGWIMVLAAAIYAVVSGMQITVSTSDTVDTLFGSGSLVDQFVGMDGKILSIGGLLNIPILNGIMATLFSLLCTVCFLVVRPVLEVGYDRFLMESRQGNSPLATMLGVFQNGNSFGKVWITQMIVGLKIVLWCFLLIVPGIVKSYEYCMVPFLLAENPWLTSDRAQQISRQMTQGEKWNIFVLDLSFLGWSILASLIAGVIGAVLGLVHLGWLGVGAVAEIAVSTYRNSTRAELYAALRAKADATDILQPGELAGFVTYQ